MKIECIGRVYYDSMGAVVVVFNLKSGGMWYQTNRSFLKWRTGKKLRLKKRLRLIHNFCSRSAKIKTSPNGLLWEERFMIDLMTMKSILSPYHYKTLTSEFYAGLDLGVQ